MLGFLIRGGAPLDAIGIEAHFGYQLAAPVHIWRNLDRFAAFGKKLRITEFDVNVAEEALQADYTRDFLTAVFAHASVDSLTLWGFWEARMYKPRGALYRRDWSIKPNGEAYLDLVFHKWWTDVTKRTGEDGTITIRGFLGDYELAAEADGNVATALAKLPREGTVVTLPVRRA